VKLKLIVACVFVSNSADVCDDWLPHGITGLKGD